MFTVHIILLLHVARAPATADSADVTDHETPPPHGKPLST